MSSLEHRTTGPLEQIVAGLEHLTARPHRVVGDEVVGPGTTSVVIAAHPEVAETEQVAHLDVGYTLNRDRPDSTIWDCASGFGATRADAVGSAVDAWLRTTAPVVLELLTQAGTYADHYSSAECGLTGRHVIHGPILGWGAGDGPDQLQQWWLANPVLPILAPALEPEAWPTLGALRVFFGSQRGESTVEVRVDGTASPAAADLLLRRDWPRFEQPAYARAFVLAIPEV